MDLSNAKWRKSTRSKEDGSNCVELAAVSNVIAVRDSQDPDGPKLTLTLHELESLLTTLKRS
ncbi:DUF397 domain-containing protein [Actinomadura adrarensis]|uniref:DUF397 domain-containing protein n=1 Tax=Actinomadura adrarensis TaxID=1819600 RepID=A0ABW3CUM0_9ACTN